MKNLYIFVTLVLVLNLFLCSSCSSGSNDPEYQSVTFIEDTQDKKIDVMVDGELFTSYQWQGNVCKPILFPVINANGTTITRGFPIEPKVGERADRPHQVGMWLTYGNVNGYDFWGNGSKGLGTINENGGVIKHKGSQIFEREKEGVLITSEVWQAPTGEELFNEQTEFHFFALNDIRIIDRVTTLTALEDITMPDTKEGMFGIRVARELEIPSKGRTTFYSADGTPTTVETSSNDGITGNYLSSEGLTGEDVWGTRARWMNLYGNILDDDISLVICDHPENINYPTYWHARGYGLFAANPFGVKDFTNGKDSLNFSIPQGESETIRYRVIISSGKQLSNEEIDKFADDFADKYRDVEAK